VPVAAGTLPDAWLPRLFAAIADAARAARPETILVSAGFDADARDPIGGLGLAPADFGRIGAEIRRVADRACGGRVVSVLEGGYDLAGLAEGVEAYVGGLEAGSSP